MERMWAVMKGDIYRLYLIDLIHLLQEQALEAKSERDKSLAEPENQFYEGRLSAFDDVIELIHMQAKAFQIPGENLNLIVDAKEHLS
jgi:hypothetical protein